ncbi:radical SAM protein [Reyranella sp.]|uniref:radical SAM protein n=1 Tax=Reyranella sp. TaxID=1929291 RepID=UPI0025F034DB|nr:radical SAM protein [Reyranella sp.]
MTSKMRQPSFETPPLVALSYTESCNLDCRHCYGNCSRQPDSDELTGEEWLKVVDELIADGVIQFYIEGGEPLWRPDFLGVLAHAARSAMTLLRTHGTLIDRTMAERLKEAGVGRVLVDFMGASAETHEWFTRTPSSFAAACDAVHNLVTVGVPVDVLTILNRRTAAELPALMRLASALGAKRFGVLRFYPIGRARALWDELALSLAEMTEAIQSLDPPEGLRIMQSWHPNDRNCCWQSACISARGDSIGCAYLREFVNFGNVRHTRLVDTWRNDPLYRHLREGKVEAHCSQCTASEGTQGGCRAAAYAFHGRWEAPDPFCTSLNDGVDLRVLPQWLAEQGPGTVRAPGTGDGVLPRLRPARAGNLHSKFRRVARFRTVRRPQSE